MDSGMDKERMSEQPSPLDALDDLIGAVPGPPQWSATDAADIPRLLAEIDRLRAAITVAEALHFLLECGYANMEDQWIYDAALGALRVALADRDAEINRLRAAAIAVLEGDADGMERLRAALERKE